MMIESAIGNPLAYALSTEVENLSIPVDHRPSGQERMTPVDQFFQAEIRAGRKKMDSNSRKFSKSAGSTTWKMP